MIIEAVADHMTTSDIAIAAPFYEAYAEPPTRTPGRLGVR